MRKLCGSRHQCRRRVVSGDLDDGILCFRGAICNNDLRQSAPMTLEAASAKEKPTIEHACCAQLRSRNVVVNKPIRLLTFTTLFPNSTQPSHGIFVENRLLHLIGSGKAVSTVIAPVPYFPSVLRGFGTWGHY